MRERLQFDWDAANRGHIALHRVKPEEAEEVLANDPLEVEVLVRKGESRRVCIGQIDSRRILTLVYTTRQNRIRVVTAYPSNRQQRELYESQ